MAVSVNEYGVTLDRNGYAPSIIPSVEGCFWCGRKDGKLDRHEVFHGAYREKSKALGLWVNMCHECHMRLHHKDAQIDATLKKEGQCAAMALYGWGVSEFRRRFEKNYL